MNQVFSLSFVLLLFTTPFSFADIAATVNEKMPEGSTPVELDRVVRDVEEINAMRETLVMSVPKNPTPETFKAVCKPVGIKAKKFAQMGGYKIRQVSKKARNPGNQPTKDEYSVLKKFRLDRQLKGYWIKKSGKTHYFRRITVREKCLTCHGKKDDRPEFIKQKYPYDRAFGFKVGDLRGMYSLSY